MAYHDRLAALAREADLDGDTARSRRIQRAAGELAARHEEVARRPRGGKRHGPGTYPWQECVQDQRARGKTEEIAREICGRIRADSRQRYPEYWSARGQRNPAPASNPFPLVPLVALGAHAGTEVATRSVASHIANPDEPFCALNLDAGPHWKGGIRDHLVVLDRAGNIIEVWENAGAADMAAFNATHPGLPVFGPLHVLATDIRDARKSARKLVRSVV